MKTNKVFILLETAKSLRKNMNLLEIAGHIPLTQACIKIFIQSLAGLASYRLARLIWSLDLIEDHHERYYEVDCESDLKVALLTGLALELGASLSDTWLGLQTVSSMNLLDEFIKYFNAAMMIVFGKPVFSGECLVCFIAYY